MILGFRVDFSLFDSDGDGVVTEGQGVKALRACGLCLAHDELVKCLQDVSDGRKLTQDSLVCFCKLHVLSIQKS